MGELDLNEGELEKLSKSLVDNFFNAGKEAERDMDTIYLYDAEEPVLDALASYMRTYIKESGKTLSVEKGNQPYRIPVNEVLSLSRSGAL